ncbi:hypothetical protein [Aeromicrobium piscarium]|uniref:Nuclear transport factor 2 family protein n=1 Tax=Aeromicrobium piscarium TaxID=2590901 RepID=A0A554RNE8_9ACTN|nr:hypothetical protein [Aeromicrobium piscarium]TSD55552.1 hypothetical protein FNM00_16710 [Aeromicrobium piscarium]
MDDLLAAILVLLPRSGAGDPCRVLDGLDLHRAVAYARLDPDGVTAQYAERAQTDDIATAEDYRRRGVRIEGGRVERQSCEEADGRLRVSERLGPAVAVLPDGERQALPREPWQEREVRLVVEHGRWRIASVRDPVVE